MELSEVLAKRTELHDALAAYKLNPDPMLLTHTQTVGKDFAMAAGAYALDDPSMLSDVFSMPSLQTPARVEHVRSTIFDGVVNIVDKDTAPIGSRFYENGIEYLIVDNDMIRDWITYGGDRVIVIDDEDYVFGASLRRIYTGRVTDFSGLFEDDDTFNGNIAYWDTKSAVNMDRMFKGATSFNRNLARWDVYNVSSSIDFDTGAVEWEASRPNFV